MSRPCWRLPLSWFVLALSLSQPTPGATPHEPILLTGDDLGGGLSVDQLGGLVAVDSSGRVVVGVSVEGFGVTYANDSVLYEWVHGSLAQICREGDPFAPLGTGVSSGCAGGAVAAQQRVFGGTRLSGDGIDSGNDTGYVLLNGSVPTLVAREGSEAPQTGAALYGPLGGYPYRVNSTGTVLFGALIGNPPDSVGLWGGSPASPTLVARTGFAAPQLGGDFTELGAYVLNPSGRYALRAVSVARGVGGGEGIWFGQGGGAPTLLKGTGGSDPAGGGTFATFGAPTISRAGGIAFEATLSSGLEGIWAAGTVFRRVALEGETPPDGGLFEFFWPPVMSGWGLVAFRARFSSASLDGLYLETDAGLVTVVREGDPAPNLTATTFTDLRTNPIPNLYGQVAFQATITGPSGARQSIWVRHIDGSLGLVARVGEQLEVASGDFRTVRQLRLMDGGANQALTGGTDEGGLTSFNDDGELVYWADFTDNSKGLFYTQPEPTGYSIFADGFESGDTTAW